jgi:GDP-4-dehydro-6-deoxy-D-mannose reductase
VTNALVTGARGFAGGYLANHLAQSGITVTGWMRPKKGSGAISSRANEIAPDPFFDPAIQWQEVDLLDREAVVHALNDLRPTVVYHCAGAAHVGESFTAVRDTLADNVLGTHHLLDGLRVACLAARVLITGSSLVYRQSDRPLHESDPIGPATPYALSKLAQEMLGRRSIVEDGQTVFLTRSFNHTGPRQKPSFAAPGFARQIALIEKGRLPAEIAVGNLEASRDLHDVRDTVRAYCRIVDRGQPGATYNVCSGRAFKISDVLDRLLKMSRVSVTVRIDPARQRPHDNPVLIGDPSKIASELGWRPSMDLDRTLADLLDYWRKEIE